MANGPALSGEGTVESPYLVGSVEDLNEVRNDLTAHYRQTANIDFNGQEFEQINGFTGVYEGNNFFIENVKVITDPVLNKGVVLFGSIGGDNSKNTVIKNVHVRGTVLEYSGSGRQSFFGIIRSAGRNTLIYNCSHANMTAVGTGGLINGEFTTFSGFIGEVEDNAIIERCMVEDLRLYVANNLSSLDISGFCGHIKKGDFSRQIPAPQFIDCYVNNCTFDMLDYRGDGTPNRYSNYVYFSGFGESNLDSDSNSYEYPTIKNCYVNAEVLLNIHYLSTSNGGSRGFFKPSRTKDIQDNSNGKIQNCYVNMETSMTIEHYAEGKSTEEMQQQSTYVNWDFIDTWMMGPDGFPALQSIPINPPDEGGGGDEDEFPPDALMRFVYKNTIYGAHLIEEGKFDYVPNPFFKIVAENKVYLFRVEEIDNVDNAEEYPLRIIYNNRIYLVETSMVED